MSQESSRKMTRTAKGVLIGVAVLIVAAIGFAVSIYAFPQTEFSQKVSARIGLPIAFLDMRHTVNSKNWEQNTLSTLKLYTERKDDLLQAGLSIDFSGPDGEKLLAVKRKEILNKMIEDMVIEKLATDRGLTVSNDDLTKNVDQVLSENGNSEKFQQKLSTEYGWSMDDFKRIVVRPELLSEALETYFNKQNQDSGPAKKSLVEAQRQLAGGTSFADVAKQYSEGTTAKEAGDLGWLPLDAIAPEIAILVKDQPLHVPTGIIETSLGFHIVEVEEREQKNGAVLVHLRQIFAKRQSYLDWLEAEKQQAKLRIPLRGYQWNAETGRVEFTDENMKHFEENVRQEAAGLIL
jgi:parvulin-like peptidyl-prolyl isomerase